RPQGTDTLASHASTLRSRGGLFARALIARAWHSAVVTVEWLTLADELARWAIEHVGPVRRRAVATKTGPTDLVTDADRAIERHVRDTVLLHFPDHRVVGEEFGGTPDNGPTWYVDPIDGTTNFARGVPWFSFSVGIVVNGALVAGVVADLVRSEVISA